MKIAAAFHASSCSGQDSRCLCGSLLARLRIEGVELKCRRCKRVVIIPWDAVSTGQWLENESRDEGEE